MKKIGRVCNHSFLLGPLTPGSIVLDCGVNRGQFSRWLSEHIGCSVHGLEPDPRLFDELPRMEGATFHRLALSDETGRATLHLGGSACSSIRYPGTETDNSTEVQTTTIEHFCKQHAIDRIDLLKLDIEGAEVSVLQHVNPAFLRTVVAQISVEFHDHIDPESVSEIRSVLKRLSELGFYSIKFSHFTHNDVLSINLRLFELTTSDKIRFMAIKYWRGGVRLLKRGCGIRQSARGSLADRPVPRAGAATRRGPVRTRSSRTWRR